MKKKMVKLICAGLCAMMVLGSTACGKSESTANFNSAKPIMGLTSESYATDSATADYGYSAAEPMSPEYEESGSGASATSSVGTVASSNRKLIRNVALDVETTEFDNFVNLVYLQVDTLGGYIENMNTYSGSRYGSSVPVKSSSMVVRIPKNSLDQFLNAVSDAGNVTNRSENVDDVTLTYVDMESRKKSLQTEYDRLLVLLESAETLEDIITLEDRLTSIRYQMESIEAQLRSYDNQVDYSTVRMSISEVKELTPVEEETTGEKMMNGLKESLEDIRDGFIDFAIEFVARLPYLVIWGVIGGIVITVFVKLVRKSMKKAEKAKNEETKKQTSENQETK